MLRNRKLWATMTVALVILVVLSACAPAPGQTPEPGVKEVTRVVEVTREVPAAERKLKAGFIYVGPIGDYGWSHAHNQARLFVENQFPWLETVYAEAVPEADVERFLDRFIVEEGCDVVFTTSFGFMDGTMAAANKYPDKIFFHCSGFKRTPNSGTYFIDFYQLYYLNGLMAGALTKSGKVGYVGAHPIPEVVRHIDAFTLGVREVNPEATVDVRWLFAWYDPAKAREAAEALIADGADVLAFTEDSPTVVQVGQEYVERGEPVYSFSHYSPMEDFGPDSAVSGQLVDWGIVYQDILMKVYLGVYNNQNLENVDYWWLMREKGA
ncbi:MAG: BMP family ABC transporter substrate-binding protein, partial [Anaerolineales bacterium]